jgi:SHAQKYF class myb-like DNA-binding protein
MTISWRVQQQYFMATSPDSEQLIRLPPTILPSSQPTYPSTPQADQPTLTPPAPRRPGNPKKKNAAQTKTREPRTNLWTLEEHQRFLLGLELFRHGPWKEVANVVGTKTTRQTMTHAQKYRQKIVRRQRLAEAIEGMTQAAIPPLPPIETLAQSPTERVSLPPSPFHGEMSSSFLHHRGTSDDPHHNHTGSLPHGTTFAYRIDQSAVSPPEHLDTADAGSMSNDGFFLRMP